VFGNEKDFWNKGMSVGLGWAGLGWVGNKGKPIPAGYCYTIRLSIH
jgi:hypothetical protein